MRARAQATVRAWKKRPELQAHSRIGIRSGCGLPVATGLSHDDRPYQLSECFFRVIQSGASSSHYSAVRWRHGRSRRRPRWRAKRAASAATPKCRRESRRPSDTSAAAGRKSPRMGRPIRAAAARPRLDRGPHHRDRVPLGRGRPERYAAIAAEFVRLKVDVILAGGTEPAIAAKQATSVIPIIFPTAGARSAAAWSRRWRDRAATPPACRTRAAICLPSASSSCARFFRACADWPSWSMPTIPAA